MNRLFKIITAFILILMPINFNATLAMRTGTNSLNKDLVDQDSVKAFEISLGFSAKNVEILPLCLLNNPLYATLMEGLK